CARNQPITVDELTKQLGRLGHTDFQLSAVDATILGDPMVPRSMLGDARREIVQQLVRGGAACGTRSSVAPPGVLPRLRAGIAGGPGFPSDQQTAQLHVLCRSLSQV